MLLAHGVGRIYQLPVPLSYYLTGSALAVAGSFVTVALLGRREAGEPGAVAGPRAAAWLAGAARAALWAGFVLALVTGVVDNATGFGFAAIWLWVGLVVGFTVVNLILGDLWRLADPWLPLATVLGGGSPRRPAGGLAWAGPVLLYGLFWFELASTTGFEIPLITRVLLVYAIYATLIRVRFENWELMDPFCILWSFASRSSMLRVTEEGILRHAPGAGEPDRRPMPGPLYASLFLLLGATSLDNLRETPAWASFQSRNLPGVPELLYDTVALLLLALPFLLSFRLALLPARTPEGGEARPMAWSLTPIAIAYLLAHNVSLVMVTLREWTEAVADPLGLGWNLLGLRNALPDFVPSPALVWFLEVGLVVGGHILGVVMAHRIASGARGRRVAFLEQIPMTLLMTAYTVGTLWLLSLAVVRS